MVSGSAPPPAAPVAVQSTSFGAITTLLALLMWPYTRVRLRAAMCMLQDETACTRFPDAERTGIALLTPTISWHRLLASQPGGAHHKQGLLAPLC